MNFVVGSGPAGVSAAMALLKRDLPVTMIDTGLELEPERKQIVEQLRGQLSQDWDAKVLAEMRGHVRPELSGVPIKYIYGSDFHVRGIHEHIFESLDGPQNYCSLARGGLSNVWGAAILPYSEDDLRGWPVGTKEMGPYYQEVLRFMPLTAAHDDLENFFPLYSDQPQQLAPSEQGANLLRDLQRHQEQLHRKNIYFGQARLAVENGAAQSGYSCVRCGMCMHGCPYGLIYNSGVTVDQMLKNPKFKYVKGVIIDRVKEQDGTVTLSGTSLLDQSPVELTGQKVYLACGVVNTAKIVLSSIDDSNVELPVKTSQHFIMPLLRFASTPNVGTEQLHTLSQVFIELLTPDSPTGNCHLQIYSYNDFYPTFFKNKLGAFYPFIKNALENKLLSRLLVVQGYLSSAYSPALRLHLDKTSGKVRVRSIKNRRVWGKLFEIMARLYGSMNALRALPMVPFLKISHGGMGAHIGASFPMKTHPSSLETDVLGRLPRFKSVHIVDASVFSDIPPSTVTMTTMANAFRIASQSNPSA